MFLSVYSGQYTQPQQTSFQACQLNQMKEMLQKLINISNRLKKSLLRAQSLFLALGALVRLGVIF